MDIINIDRLYFTTLPEAAYRYQMYECRFLRELQRYADLSVQASTWASHVGDHNANVARSCGCQEEFSRPDLHKQ